MLRLCRNISMQSVYDLVTLYWVRFNTVYIGSVQRQNIKLKFNIMAWGSDQGHYRVIAQICGTRSRLSQFFRLLSGPTDAYIYLHISCSFSRRQSIRLHELSSDPEHKYIEKIKISYLHARARFNPQYFSPLQGCSQWTHDYTGPQNPATTYPSYQ